MPDGDLYMDQIVEEVSTQLDAGQEASKESQEPPKEEKTETTSSEPEGEEQAQPYYTPEELEEIIKNDLPVDFKRLSPEGQAIWKSADRGFKPKLEEAARIRREFEQFQQQVQRLQPPSQRQPQTVDEMFYNDPDGTLKLVRQRIYEEKQKDPFSADVIKLEQLRDDLLDKRNMLIQQQIQQKLIMDEAQMTIRTQIPDFETKKPKLNEFAKRLGYSDQEISYLTDPRIHGPMATKAVLFINSLYDKMSAGELKKKEVKEAMKVEKAGSGHEMKKEKEWTQEDYLSARRKQSIL